MSVLRTIMNALSVDKVTPDNVGHRLQHYLETRTSSPTFIMARVKMPLFGAYTAAHVMRDLEDAVLKAQAEKSSRLDKLAPLIPALIDKYFTPVIKSTGGKITMTEATRTDAGFQFLIGTRYNMQRAATIVITDDAVMMHADETGPDIQETPLANIRNVGAMLAPVIRARSQNQRRAVVPQHAQNL